MSVSPRSSFTFRRPVFLGGASLLTVAMLLAGCDTPDEPALPTPPPVVSAPNKQAAAPNPHAGMQPGASPSGSPVAAAPVNLVWDVPEGWTSKPPRPMRKATFEAAGKAGPAEIAVFYFGPGQGGDVEANIQRWIGQFEELPAKAVKRSEGESNGLKHFHVRVEQGTFSSKMPGSPSGPKKDWAMSATIVQAPSGQYFFKMTGPSATVAVEQEKFKRLLESVRPKK